MAGDGGWTTTYVDVEAEDVDDRGRGGAANTRSTAQQVTLREMGERRADREFVAPADDDDDDDDDDRNSARARLDRARAEKEEAEMHARARQFDAQARRKRRGTVESDESDDGSVNNRQKRQKRPRDDDDGGDDDDDDDDDEPADFGRLNRRFNKQADPIKERTPPPRQPIRSQSSMVVRRAISNERRRRPVDRFNEDQAGIAEEIDQWGRRVENAPAEPRYLVHDPYDKAAARDDVWQHGLPAEALAVVRVEDMAPAYREWRARVRNIESQLKWPTEYESMEDFRVIAEGVGDAVGLVAEMEEEEIRAEVASFLMRLGGDRIFPMQMTLKQSLYIGSTTFPPVEVATQHHINAVEHFYLTRYSHLFSAALRVIPNAQADRSLGRMFDLLVNRINLVAKTWRTLCNLRWTFGTNYHIRQSPLGRMQYFALDLTHMDMNREQLAIHVILRTLSERGYRHRGAFLFEPKVVNGVSVNYFQPVYDEPKVQMTIARFIRLMLSANSKGSSEWLQISAAIGKLKSIAGLIEGMDHVCCPKLTPDRGCFAYANGVWSTEEATLTPHALYSGAVACRYFPLRLVIPGGDVNNHRSLAHLNFFGPTDRDPRFAAGVKPVYPIPKRCKVNRNGVITEEPFEQQQEELALQIVRTRAERPAYVESTSVGKTMDAEELEWQRGFLGSDLRAEGVERREIDAAMKMAANDDDDDDNNANNENGVVKDFDSDDDDDDDDGEMADACPDRDREARRIDAMLRSLHADIPDDITDAEVPAELFMRMKEAEDVDEDLLEERVKAYIDDMFGSDGEEEIMDTDKRDALLDWMNIPTPVIDRIIMTQFVDPEEIRAKAGTAGGATRVKNARLLLRFVYAFLGRSLYELLKHDAWSKSMFVSGEGGTGKSIIADALLYIYPAAFTSTMSAQSEKGFGLEALMKAWLVIGDEMRKGTTIGVTDILKMIEAGRLQVRMKNKIAEDIDWSAALFLFGNDLAEVWRESRNSLNRRLLILIFNVIVGDSQKDERLREHVLKYELAALVVKFTVAYRSLVRYMHEHNVNNIEAIFHEYFKEQSEKFLAENNYLYAFLQSSDVVLRKHEKGNHCYVPLAVFQWAMRKWCERQGKYYRWQGDSQSNGPFKRKNIGYVANAAGEKNLQCAMTWPNIGCDHSYHKPGEYLVNLDLQPHVIQAFFDDPANSSDRRDRTGGGIINAFHGSAPAQGAVAPPPRPYAAPGMQQQQQQPPPPPPFADMVCETCECIPCNCEAELAELRAAVSDVDLVIAPDFERNIERGTYYRPSDEDMEEMEASVRKVHEDGREQTVSMESLLNTVQDGVDIRDLVNSGVFSYRTADVRVLAEVTYEAARRALQMTRLSSGTSMSAADKKQLKKIKTALKKIVKTLMDNIPAEAHVPDDDDDDDDDGDPFHRVAPAYDETYGAEGRD